MLLAAIFCLSLILLAVNTQTTAGPYGQCGGSGYNGPTACGSGYACTSYNPYYYQCYPGIAGTTTTSTRATLSSSLTTTTAYHPTSSSTTTATGGSGSLPTTLLDGWYWIRAVESPYFHSYLQTKPTGIPGDALLDSYTSAGQFNIIDGQLVYNLGSAGQLYMNVESPVDKTQRALGTWFNATQNSYGSFAFSGDTVTWTDPDVQRPNTAAFYVCGNNELYINTGPYLYQTPDGCWDVDIHYYGGSTANL